MANVLIVHATRHGQTTKIARRMETALRREGHAVQLVDASRPPKSVEVWRFDVTFVGAPMYAGHYPASIVRFVRSQREFLQRGVSAFFSVNLAVASHTTDGRSETLPRVERFIEETGWRPSRVELIAGALAYTKYNFFIRLLMRRMARKAGGDTDTSRDHEYTDWAAVERFALEVMDQIAETEIAPPPPDHERREAMRASAPDQPASNPRPASSRSMTSGV
jgi:menaquinone-dependent protoporphyrinogen oxidase